MSEETSAVPPGVAVCPVPVNVPKYLTPEEAERIRKEVQESFDLVDADKSGHVDATEVENVLRSFNRQGSYITFSDEQIKELGAEFIRLRNAKGDGQVTFDELYKAVLKDSGYAV